MNIIDDVYYLKKYVALYLKEDQEIFEFQYERNGKFFYNISIKRPIKIIANVEVNEGYYDLESTYGYSGIYANTNDETFLNAALIAYAEQCKQENIIAEFIRFHPFNNFPIFLNQFFDMNIYDRDVVYTDLTISRDERWNTYSSNVRNILRRCKKDLLFYKSDNLSTFIDLYRKTMDKNHADRFYYFDNRYFEDLFALENVELYNVEYKGTLVSSSFFMFSPDFGHYHLSANNYQYARHNANYFILDSIFDVAKERNIQYFVLGGGRTNYKEDSLLKFKEKFSPLTKPFYIAGKVYNNEIYQKYNVLWESQTASDVKYFLKYRLEIQ